MSTNPNADYLMQRAVASGITDPSELANFMGQMQVESRNFTHLEENLHYSGGRLLAVFHGRNGIDNISAADRIAAGGPEVIANAVYGGHFGLENLGNTEPGDGYKYRGRGFVQLTGRYRYAEYSRLTGLDLVHHVEAFQRDHGLVVDGKAGHLTRQALQTASGLVQETTLIREGSRMPFGFSDPAHPQHAMYTYLKGILPAASDERFCQATAACHVAGIDKPADLSAVHITDSRMLFCTGSLFANMAEIDLARPIPAVRQSLQQVEQFDQQLQMQVRHTMQQQPSEGPVLRP